MKFIETVPYYNTSHKLLPKEDYMALQVNSMLKQGFESIYLIYDPKKIVNKKEVSKNLNSKVKVIIFTKLLDYICYIQKNSDAIVFANDRIPSAFICSFFTKKSFFMSHQSTLPKSKLKTLIFSFFVKRFKHIKVSNTFEKQELLKIGVKAERIEYIPLAIDHDFFSKKISEKQKLILRKKYNLNKKDKVILFLAVIRKFKNAYNILRAIKELTNKDKNIKLLVVGQDKLNEENAITLSEYSKQLNIEKNIIFTGNLNPNEIREIFNIVDIGVNSSIHEGQCLVVYEIASHNIPLCLSNIGSFTSVFEKTALYHDNNDYITLAKNIQTYLNNPSISRQHASANKKIVQEKCDYESVKKKITKFFNTI